VVVSSPVDKSYIGDRHKSHRYLAKKYYDLLWCTCMPYVISHLDSRPLLLLLLLLLRFFKFLEPNTKSVGVLGRGISPSQGLYLHTEQHKQRINSHNTDIHALSGIRTHNPSIRESEDSLRLRPRGHCDRPIADRAKK
jgi:hypothetical protein